MRPNASPRAALERAGLALIAASPLVLAACGGTPAPDATPPASPPLTHEPGVLATRRSPEEQREAVPALATYESDAAEALASSPPILLLTEELTDDEQRLAQTLAIQDPDFLALAADPLTGEPVRSEIMSVRPVLASDVVDANASCAQTTCYRVDLYNFATNAAAIAFVDVHGRRVVTVQHQPNAQPDINHRLLDLAVGIAVTAPEVEQALGFSPAGDEATMPNVKTALNGTRCERSRHLCVAPTFLIGDRALFAIVDLTDKRLVGVRWTDLGESGPSELITERSLQNEYVMANFCERTNSLARDGWDMDYMITSSDGLKVADVSYDGRPVLRSAKLVDWHVSYSREDGFGYSDAIGCPMVSSAGAVAFEGPTVEDIVDDEGAAVGFALVQDFRSPVWPAPCNYRYEQRYEFYSDGRYRVVAGNLGRGCGNDGTYRPVLRIDPTASGDGMADEFAEWDGDGWVTWAEEGWRGESGTAAYTPQGYRYRILGEDGAGYYIEPGRGQFGDGGRGDDELVYVAARDPDRDEGDSDMVTIGSCCNTDYQQGPEQFLDPPEPIDGADLVVWYVAELHNDDTPGSEYCWADTSIVAGEPVVEVWPCYSGPMFVPIADTAGDD